jgi:hypothetical protein
VAPPAGLAVRISGATQAAAPAVANRDMRLIAWRLERRDSPGTARDAATSPCASSLRISTAILTRLCERPYFISIRDPQNQGVGARQSGRRPA